MVAARDSAQLCLTTSSPIFWHEFRLNFLITTGNKNENNHVTKARMVCKLELLNQLKVRAPNTEKCMIVEYEECRLIVMRNALDFQIDRACKRGNIHVHPTPALKGSSVFTA